MKKLGIVSLESSHVDMFCRAFNLPADDWHLPQARVVAVCPQDNTSERIAEVCRRFAISAIVEDPVEMVPLVDAALILGRDGARHCAQARPLLEAGKPCFVDKPFAHSMEDAARMIETARAHSAALMTASAIRYAVELEEAAEAIAALGELKHCSLLGPGELFFYGCHLAELLLRLMGPGAEVVADVREQSCDLITVSYGDGRSAALQLLRGPSLGFAAYLVGAKGALPLAISNPLYYRRTMEAFVTMLETSEEPVPEAEMLETVRLLVAADRSAAQGGRPVRLAGVFPYKQPF